MYVLIAAKALVQMVFRWDQRLGIGLVQTQLQNLRPQRKFEGMTLRGEMLRSVLDVSPRFFEIMRELLQEVLNGTSLVTRLLKLPNNSLTIVSMRKMLNTAPAATTR
jgi:hypothetical protein